MSRYFLILFSFSGFLFSCSSSEKDTKPHLFSLVASEESGLNFSNDLTYTEDFNPYTYRNFYNGGGVALGDINNDGLVDIYLSGNQVDNKLYLNLGELKFKDITEEAGVSCSDVWSTGVTMVDINGDDLLDIYVCKGGNPDAERRNNELFINNGDLTFTEMSKDYGLDIKGLSIQAGFFDFDNDGDLDCYLLNNSMRSVGGFDLVEGQRFIHDEEGNKFLENIGNRFVDKTQESSIYSSKIGYGLGITMSDFDGDNTTDLFISNDFFEKDYLYLHPKGKSFIDTSSSFFPSLSLGSMGADAADLDNDLLPDLFVTEMLPRDKDRRKTKAIYDSWDKQLEAVKKGYGHQYPRNVLQRNMGSAGFFEIGRMAHVAGTDWSWSALIQDYDNDGLKDIFVSNGIFKDLLDRDFLSFVANDSAVRKLISQEKEAVKKLIDKMPSEALPNAFFRNRDDFSFEYNPARWMADTSSFSNGSAYADLDNDGDLELVVNNVNMPVFLYENHSHDKHFLNMRLRNSSSKNTWGVGAKVILFTEGKEQICENYFAKGFQSSTAHPLHFGLGQSEKVDSIKIIWPDASTQVISSVPIDTNLVIEKDSTPEKIQFAYQQRERPFELVDFINFTHQENEYNQFNSQRMMWQMNSNFGPALASHDVNGDGWNDYLVGGAKGQASRLFLSTSESEFSTIEIDDAVYEAVDAEFADLNNDGQSDLVIAYGGMAYTPYSPELSTLWYPGEKNGFSAGIKVDMPDLISSSCLDIADYDNDGDLDLFLGEYGNIYNYGIPGSGYIMNNDGKGNFSVSGENSEVLKDLGLISDACWVDLDSDGWMDLIVVGEWMPIEIFMNRNGRLENQTKTYFKESTRGIWHSVYTGDINRDGKIDIVAGNEGLNNFFEPGMRMFVGDFDDNGFEEHIICYRDGQKYYPIYDKDELQSQVNEIKKKVIYYRDYSNSSMYDLFDRDKIASSRKYDLHELKTSAFLQKGNKFEKITLPKEVQYSSVYAISDGEGAVLHKTSALLLGGNQYLVKPQWGRQDASNGWLLKAEKSGDSTYFSVKSLGVKGQIRKIVPTNENKIVFGINNEKVKTIEVYEDQ